MKILMVCLGNICRSPLAEEIMRDKLLNRGLDYIVDSAGMSDWHEGEKPDRRSIEVAKKHGLDITHQRSRPFIYDDLKEFDIIFAMDRENYRDIISLAKDKSEIEKVHLLLEFAETGMKDVPDPYFGNSDDGFEDVFKLLDDACEKILNKYLLASNR